ncbi:MAG: AMP-dependent synthetase/ligase [Gemmatimonadota bacterium]
MKVEAGGGRYRAGPLIPGLTAGTLTDLFLASAERFPGTAAITRQADGQWKDLDRAELVERIRGIAAGLRAVGCEPGDRVAILSHTRLEWGLVDWASLLGRQVVVTVYPVLPPDQVSHILRDSGTRVVFAADTEQLAKITAIHAELENLETAVVFDVDGEDPAARADAGLTVLSLAGLEAMGREAPAFATFEEEARRIQSADLATLIYTSGTTGKPKGVMLTHRNLAANVRQAWSCLPISETDTCLSWLPLSHGFERTAGHLLMWSAGVKIAYAESTETVARDMMEVRPTLIIAVPRLYEKFYEAVEEAVARGGPVKRAMFAFARYVGARYSDRAARGRSVGLLTRLGHAIADRLVFSKLRARTGDRVRYFISGAAPLSAEINRFFFASGMTVLEGYGLTETSPVTNVNPPEDIRFGTVGPPVPGTELAIADDGEIMFRGPQVMAGYYNAPEATSAAVEPDGWLHTGDIGELDGDGYLTITDRKKNIIVTAAGKNVVPVVLEERMARSPLVENVLLVGDRRKFTIVLAVPNLAALQAAFPDRAASIEERANLASEPEVQDVLEADILPRVASFARYERPKLVVPLPEPFTVDNGLLTPTMKVRRRAVSELYAELIEQRFEEAEREYEAREKVGVDA